MYDKKPTLVRQKTYKWYDKKPTQTNFYKKSRINADILYLGA